MRLPRLCAVGGNIVRRAQRSCTVPYLHGLVVHDIAFHNVNVAQVRDSRLQVRAPLFVAHNGEDRGVRPGRL